MRDDGIPPDEKFMVVLFKVAEGFAENPVYGSQSFCPQLFEFVSAIGLQDVLHNAPRLHIGEHILLISKVTKERVKRNQHFFVLQIRGDFVYRVAETRIIGEHSDALEETLIGIGRISPQVHRDDVHHFMIVIGFDAGIVHEHNCTGAVVREPLDSRAHNLAHFIPRAEIEEIDHGWKILFPQDHQGIRPAESPVQYEIGNAGSSLS